MGGSEGGRTASQPEAAAAASFALERFDWVAPDLLEVAGRFSNVPETAVADPVLIIRSGERTHRLGMAPESEPRSGRVGLRRFGGAQWRALFEWPGPPRSVDRAALELGEGFVVELPRPGAPRTGRRVLDVGRRALSPLAGADQIRLQAELTAAREEAEDARGQLNEAEQVVRRLRQDLEVQRKRREAEATRFHEALEDMRGTAEEAVSAERNRAEALRAELQGAQETAEQARRDLEAMREELTAAADARAGHDRLEAELADQRQQVAEAREELQRVTDDRDAAVQQIAALHADLDGLARAEDELGAQIDRLRTHLTTAREMTPDEEATSPGHAPSEQ
jgi:cell division protein FtsB